MGGGKGGSSSSTTTYNYDPAYNKRMAAIAERQQSMSEDLWKTYKQYFQDYEIAAATANKELLPYITDASRATLEEQVRDLEMNRAVKDALRSQQLKELEMSTPVAEKFYQEVTKDIDEGGLMREARAGVMRDMENQEAASLREAARMGMDTNDPRLAAMLKQSGVDKARAAASAAWQAKKSAEDTEFSRLGAGMTMRGRATGLPGIASTQGNNTQQFATPDMSGKAMAGMAGAGSTYGILASRPMSQTTHTTTSGGGGLFGDLFGTAGGIILGKYL